MMPSSRITVSSFEKVGSSLKKILHNVINVPLPLIIYRLLKDLIKLQMKMSVYPIHAIMEIAMILPMNTRVTVLRDTPEQTVKRVRTG